MAGLSSRYLFHYKSDIEIINDILKNGFRYNLWDEDLPYANVGQQNFIICFCDIKIEESQHHRTQYGNNALVLRKSWAIKNGISPVRYIHKESPGTWENYIFNKHIYRAASKHGRTEWNETFYHHVIYTILKVKGVIKRSRPLEVYQIEAFKDQFLEAEKEFLTFYRDLPDDTFREKFSNYIQYLVRNIAELHSELELRDAFIRSYEENGNIIYDEREWRSYKFISTDEILENSLELNTAEINGYLPKSYNLLFNEEDIVAILVENKNNKEAVKDFLKTQQGLINSDFAEKIIYFTKDFREHTCI